MTIRRIFCIIMAVISLLGIIGASSLRMTRGTSLGPGMMPMIYSVLLLLLSICYFLSRGNGEEKKIAGKDLFKYPTIQGVIFFGLNLAMFLALYLFGTVAALATFCVASLTLLKRMGVKKALLFSVLWVGTIYVVFVLLLGVPFEEGILVKAFYKAFIY